MTQQVPEQSFENFHGCIFGPGGMLKILQACTVHQMAVPFEEDANSFNIPCSLIDQYQLFVRKIIILPVPLAMPVYGPEIQLFNSIC